MQTFQKFSPDRLGRAFVMALLLTAFVAALGGATSDAEAKRMYSLKIGAWKGGAYSSNRTGKFSHCVAVAKYKSGISLYFFVTAKRKWSMGFFNSEWEFDVGSRFQVRYQVDKGRVNKGTAIATARSMARVAIPARDRIFAEFRRGNLLKVKTSQKLLKFRLTNTSKMLKRLLNCVIRNTRGGGGGDNPFKKKKKNPFGSSSS